MAHGRGVTTGIEGRSSSRTGDKCAAAQRPAAVGAVWTPVRAGESLTLRGLPWNLCDRRPSARSPHDIEKPARTSCSGVPWPPLLAPATSSSFDPSSTTMARAGLCPLPESMSTFLAGSWWRVGWPGQRAGSLGRGAGGKMDRGGSSVSMEEGDDGSEQHSGWPAEKASRRHRSAGVVSRRMVQGLRAGRAVV
jgi:hypothetical protein